MTPRERLNRKLRRVWGGYVVFCAGFAVLGYFKVAWWFPVLVVAQAVIQIVPAAYLQARLERELGR